MAVGGYESGGRGSKEAAADLSALQYRAIKLDADGKAAQSTAAADVCYGILQNKPAAGETAEVAHSGPSKAEIGAAVNEGAILVSSADGQLVPVSAADEYGLCQAVTAGTSAGDVIDVIITHNGLDSD